jgi:hypothetical protein
VQKEASKNKGDRVKGYEWRKAKLPCHSRFSVMAQCVNQQNQHKELHTFSPISGHDEAALKSAPSENAADRWQ